MSSPEKMNQFLYYNNKIETELNKPEIERREANLADWKAERAKFTFDKMDQIFLYYNNKIETELNKNEIEHSEANLADWRAERAKFTFDGSGGALIKIPADRPWRGVNELCPTFIGGECPRDKLIDVDRAVDAALGHVRDLADRSVRVPPVVISRVYRGGKTTLIELISKKLRESREYYVITISTNGSFAPRAGETWLQALVRLIAFQMVVPNATDSDDQCQCESSDLLNRLNEINDTGKTVVLLIDELNKMGVPLSAEISSFLTNHFLDKQGRYLIFSSHVQFNVDGVLGVPGAATMLTSPSGRTVKTLPLPFCTDREVYQTMLGNNSVTDLTVTLSVGIPSLLFIMCRSGHIRTEMLLAERFNLVVEHKLGAGRNSYGEREFLSQNRKSLLYDFLTTVIHGSRNKGFFEAFSTPVSETNPTPIDLLRFPLPYIPIILEFLGESDGGRLFESLSASAESVETGKDWEMVVVFSIYIRSLEAKYCTIGEVPLQGPFGIATDGVDNVKVLTIPQNCTTVALAVEYIKKNTQEAKTICIFQLAFAKFPDFDGFVSYRGHVGQEDPGASIIHGYQCKRTRGYPRHAVDHNIAQGWFLRGGETVKTPVRDGWRFPSMDWIETNLLGFGLRLLHPLSWGTVPESDDFV